MKQYIIIIILCLGIISCEENKNLEILPENEIQNEWIISENDLTAGGKFELMDSPKFKSVNETLGLKDSSKVALVSFKNTVRVYPYFYTKRYEIINDFFDNNYIAVSFCPLTKSAICFDRKIDNTPLNLIASGYLYKDNMVPSNEGLDFYWSQMLMKGIRGKYAEKALNSFNLIETEWRVVKEYFPNAIVFYDDVNKALEQKSSSKLDNKEFSYGIFNTSKGVENIEIFELSNFKNGFSSINKVINEKNTIIIGNNELKIFTSFYIPNGVTFNIKHTDNFPNIIQDNKGNLFNIFGYAVSGPDKGMQLLSPKAYIAQNWAWDDFFPNILQIN